MRDEWNYPASDQKWRGSEAGMSALRVALLFGSATVGLALILTPIADKQTRRMAQSPYPTGVDMMATGTIGQRNQNTYTVRRSVLQPSPNSVCIIRANGARSGEC